MCWDDRHVNWSSAVKNHCTSCGGTGSLAEVAMRLPRV